MCIDVKKIKNIKAHLSAFLTSVFENNMCWSVLHYYVQDRETLLILNGKGPTMLGKNKQFNLNN